VIFTTPNPQSFITGNYVDNNFIEWTNEHDATPAFANQFSFGGLTITGNTFLCSDVATWFSFIVVKPYGPGHFLNGFSVVGNSFRVLNGTIDRVERVDTAFADLDATKARNVTFAGNVFNNVDVPVANPLSVLHTQSTRTRTWTVDTASRLPFLGRARVIESVVPEDRLANASNAAVYEAPYVEPEIGSNGRQFRVIFGSDVSGKIRALVRMDTPV
jgi:hypothetical protein